MKLPPNKICLIVAGSQGQYGSALSKLGTRQNPNVKIKPGDKVIFSSDPIPGNENEVYAVIEDLVLQGADVIYSDIADQLHSSGHGNQEDLKFLIRFTNPKFFIPIGGTVRHQRQYQKLTDELGHKKESVFLLSEGETVWFSNQGANRGDSIDTKNIYVDAYGVGDIGNIVLRDRKTLSSEGIVVSLLIFNAVGNLVARPKILSRGFVFEKGENELYEHAIQLVEKNLKPKGGRPFNQNAIKREIITILEEFFFKERGRRPLVIAEVIQL
jgi:ribonuclease J